LKCWFTRYRIVIAIAMEKTLPHTRTKLEEFFVKQKKKLMFFSGDIPTAEELELLKDARARVGMVIKARWAILGILALYGQSRGNYWLYFCGRI
jgi:hypothetical protein